MAAMVVESLKFVLVGVPVSMAVYLSVALILALTNSPNVPSSREREIAFTSAINADYSDLPPTITFVLPFP
jgi:hypothetical protein